MAERAYHAFSEAPDWMVGEMPPGYQTRLAEIQRLSGDLHAMEAIGQVLWTSGAPLKQAVHALVTALKCDVAPIAPSDEPITVKLDGSRSLLLHVSESAAPIQKASEELTQAFQAVQHAGASDRVVLVANNDPMTPPTDRPDPVLPDALTVLQRMGVNVTTTATLFSLWKVSSESPQRVKAALDRLHAQDGGPFTA